MERQEISNEAPAASYELVLEQLRLGHGLLSWGQFVMALQNEEMHVWKLPHDQYALMTFGECADGKVANILTTVGEMKFADEGLAAIEDLARKGGCNVVMSVGRHGWHRLCNRRGYETRTCLLMKKVLT